MSAGRATRKNLAQHPRREELRANYLAALEYGVVGRAHTHKWRDRTGGGRSCRCGAVEQPCPSCASSGYATNWQGDTLGECDTCHGEGVVTA